MLAPQAQPHSRAQSPTIASEQDRIADGRLIMSLTLPPPHSAMAETLRHMTLTPCQRISVRSAAGVDADGDAAPPGRGATGRRMLDS